MLGGWKVQFVILFWPVHVVHPSKMSKDKIREIYEFFFKTADADGDGLVSGPDAAAMFRKSGLPDETLKNVRINLPTLSIEYWLFRSSILFDAD